MDLKTGFHQIRVKPEDIEKTAFNTKYGQFEYLVMHMGLCNAPVRFQSLMNQILRVLPKHTAVIVPASLQPRVLHLEHNTICGGHSGGRRMYQSLRRVYYWPRLALDCYATVSNCEACAQERVPLQKKSEKLELFPPQGPL